MSLSLNKVECLLQKLSTACEEIKFVEQNWMELVSFDVMGIL